MVWVVYGYDRQIMFSKILTKKGVPKLYSETEYNVSVGSDGFKHHTEGTVSICNLVLQLLCLWIIGNEH
jgi:hypothetical protein